MSERIKVGDYVELTGISWGSNRGRIVRITRLNVSGRAYSDDTSLGGLTDEDGIPYTGGYKIEKVVSVTHGEAPRGRLSEQVEELREAFRVLTEEVGLSASAASKVIEGAL